MRGTKFGIIDRYIIGKFLSTYITIIIMLVFIVTIFDMVEKMDDFLENHISTRAIIFDYYIYFVPFFINQFSSLITFISVIIFTSKMAYNTEIIAILSSGVSFKRLIWPYMIGAFIIAMLSISLNLFIIPEANIKKINFETVAMKKNRRGNFENYIYRQITPGNFLCLKGYNIRTKTAEQFIIETYDSSRIVKSLVAKNVSFNEETLHWKADKHIVRTYINGKEILEKREKMDTMINISSKELGKVEQYVSTLSIGKLNQFMKEQQEKGADNIPIIEVDRQNRYAYPFATFILTLIGLSLSSRKVRGGTGLHIAIGIALCFSYILFMQFASEFAKNNVVSPIIAVWFPNLLFAGIALYVYRQAPK